MYADILRVNVWWNLPLLRRLVWKMLIIKMCWNQMKKKSTYVYSKWTLNEFLSGKLGFAAEVTSISLFSLTAEESIFSLGLLLPGLLTLRFERDPDLLVLDMIEVFDCLRWSDFTNAVSQVCVCSVKGPPFLATPLVPDACLDLSICARATYA